jgi:hypothetical protein
VAPGLATCAILAVTPVDAQATGDDTASAGSGAREYSGALAFYIDNDVFLRSDDRYTSGVGVQWTSAPVDRFDRKAFVRRVAHAFSFLPTVGGPSYRNLVSFALSQEIYTPTDIESPVPPPDQQPYAGLLLLDTSVYSVGERQLHGFTLRLGCVGPCSGAEQVQRTIHEWIGSPIPQGWEYQLDDELVLNLNYDWSRRLVRHVPRGRVQYDVMVNASGGFGNYYIGASSGVLARVGTNLSESYGTASLRLAGAREFVGVGPPAGKRLRFYFFAGFRMFAVGRFLPTDGNTFTDGPRVDRDDLFGNLTSGFVLARARWKLSWTVNNVAGLTQFDGSRADDFGTLSFSWYF